MRSLCPDAKLGMLFGDIMVECMKHDASIITNYPDIAVALHRK